MARGKKPAGQQNSARRRGGEAWRWLIALITMLFAIPVLGLIVLSQTGGRLPTVTLPAVSFGASPTSAPTAARPFSPISTPTARPQASSPTQVRQESPSSSPAKATSVAVTPTARSAVATVPVAPTSTPAAKIVLKVPLYRQEHALSCEAASLRMALAAFGLQVPEDKLLASLARDPTPRKAVGDAIQWGDPDAGFVGAWDGVFLQDGYGVYEKPIADLAMSQGYEAVRYGKNVDVKQLYAAVRDGYPSVVWMPYDLSVKGRGAWTTPAGKKVSYVVTEHAVVLAGVDPEGVYYADPMKPVLQYSPFAAFEKALAELESRYVTIHP